MTEANNNAGQRRWKRYVLNDCAFVMVVKPPRLKLGKPVMVKLGPIKDIGMRGLAVQYIDHKNILRNVEELSIALPDGRIMVDRIRFRPVTDFPVAKLPDDREIRTLCVSFTRLLPLQKIQLERFIDEYASESTEPREACGAPAKSVRRKKRARPKPTG